MRARQLLTAIILLAMPVWAAAQLANPVKWTFKSKKINDKTWELHLVATIQSDWRLYAQETGEGPVPTTFKFAPNPLVSSTGKVKETGKLRKSFDKNFQAELKYYQTQVTFVQTVTLKTQTATEVKGIVEYMVSNEHEVLPPKNVDFKITVGGK